MSPRTSSRRTGARALVVTAALATTVGLGACSALGDPSAAAVLDGRTVVTQAEVATVLRELPLEITQGQPVAPSQVLTFLAVGDTVEDIAREYGTVLGEREAREFLASVDEQAGRPTGQYTEPTLQLIATNLMLGQITQSEESAAAVEERFAALTEELEVNPRYGEVAQDGSLLVVPAQHPWLPAPPGAEGAAGATDDADS